MKFYEDKIKEISKEIEVCKKSMYRNVVLMAICLGLSIYASSNNIIPFAGIFISLLGLLFNIIGIAEGIRVFELIGYRRKYRDKIKSYRE